jgi:hypothetical protein
LTIVDSLPNSKGGMREVWDNIPISALRHIFRGIAHSRRVETAGSLRLPLQDEVQQPGKSITRNQRKAQKIEDFDRENTKERNEYTICKTFFPRIDYGNKVRQVYKRWN